MKKYIILDTNIIFSDFFFTDPQLVTITRLVTTLDLRLCLPKTIFKEVINKYRFQLSMEVNKISSTSSLLSKKYKIDIGYNKIDLEKNIVEYQKFLLKKFSGFNLIIDFPTIDHEILVEKAIKRKKPFKENGVGYRDALIWQNILDLLEKGDQVFFVTKNSSDFMEGKELHIDLKSEIESKNIPINNFSIFEDLDSLFEQKIKPKLDIIKSVKDDFMNDRLKGIDTKAYLKVVASKISDFNIGDKLPDSYDHGSYQIMFHTIEQGEVDDVWMLDDSDCYINYYYNCTIHVEYFVDRTEIYLKDNHEYEIEDADWNETVALVSYSLDVKVSASLIYDYKTSREVQFEYELVE